jgi:hypothetical protein
LPLGKSQWPALYRKSKKSTFPGDLSENTTAPADLSNNM